MSEPARDASGVTDSFIRDVCERLAAGKRVRRRLPGGGRLHIDRRIPFLCVYRQPRGEKIADTARLVVSEAAYLVATGDAELQIPLAALVSGIGNVMAEEFGAFLLLEIWTASPTTIAREPRTVRRPTFRIVTSTLPVDDATVQQLHRALAEIPLRPPPLDVDVIVASSASAPDLPPLLARKSTRDGRQHALGIEVQPVYRQARTGTPYPMVFDTLRRGLSLAIKQTAYHFSITHTTHEPKHYHALGRRVAVRAATQVDEELTNIAQSFDFLLQVSPVNVAGARTEFLRQGADREPLFDYRPLVVDADAVKRRLYNLPIDRLEDPTLAHLLSDSRDELDRKITMLGDRNTPRFLYGSLSVYGAVAPALLTLANELLSRLPDADESTETERVDATTFAARAESEIARYREKHAAVAATVHIRDDITGLLVSNGDLLIGRRLNMPAARVEALLHHEVGTHVVTYYNGHSQPLGQLATGLAGYEELQEGLAVLAEHLVGGLSLARVRLLAARVVAVHSVIDGASFVDTFRQLTGAHGFTKRTAFGICVRVYRGGGLTKDAIYLRGLVNLLAYLRDGGDLETLYVGKIALAHVPVVQELRWREYLHAPPLLPHHLALPGAAGRLGLLRGGQTVFDLFREHAQ